MRTCRICGAKERDPLGTGGLYTAVAPHLGVCVDCIQAAAQAVEEFGEDELERFAADRRRI